MTSAISCRRAAMKRYISASASSSIEPYRTISRMRSPSSFPPGSRTSTGSRLASALPSSSTCVVFPDPSGPSNVMNKPRGTSDRYRGSAAYFAASAAGAKETTSTRGSAHLLGPPHRRAGLLTERAQETTPASAPFSGTPRNRKIPWGESAPGRLGRCIGEWLPGQSTLLTILEIVRVDLDVFAPLLRNFVLGEDGVDGARINASAAVDALIRIDEIHGRGLVGVNTVHRTDLYARGIFHPDAGLNDDISHVPQGYHAPDMPESEPKPKLIELVAPGAGQGWKATLKSGKAVVIHEIPAPAAEAAAAVPRIQRLADHRHPTLAPVLAWGTDPNGIWVAVEPNEGTPLGTILSRGPLTPPAAAALGAAVLSGVAALHEAGIAMGGFGASAIRVTGNGEVRLTGHPAAA